MFYIKENLNDTTSISVEINNENVYCRCPQCSAEVPVDLSIFWTAENFDIFSSAVYCDACTQLCRNRRENRRNTRTGILSGL